MLNLRKETSLAIQLLKCLSLKKAEPTSLKEISDELDVSFLFLQKIARKLKAGKLIEAVQGVKGGYILLDRKKDLNLLEIMEVMEDQCTLLKCMRIKNCKKYKKCSTRIEITKLNKKIVKLIETVKLKNL